MFSQFSFHMFAEIRVDIPIVSIIFVLIETNLDYINISFLLKSSVPKYMKSFRCKSDINVRKMRYSKIFLHLTVLPTALLSVSLQESQGGKCPLSVPSYVS